MNQIRRDLHRVLSVPAPWILLTIEIVFAVGTSAAMKVIGTAPSPALALGFLPAIAGVFGAVSAGADFRFGAVPGEVLALGGPLNYFLRTFASILAVAAVGGGIGAGTAAATWTLLEDHPPAPARVAALVLAGVVASACWAVVGAALAIATKSQVSAVASILTYLMLIEPVLEVSARNTDKILPGHVAVELFSLESVTAVGVTGFRLVALAAGLLGLTCALLRHREVAVTMA
jgi:hypothetical protein